MSKQDTAAERILRRAQEVIAAGQHTEDDLSDEQVEHVAAILHGHGHRHGPQVA